MQIFIFPHQNGGQNRTWRTHSHVLHTTSLWNKTYTETPKVCFQCSLSIQQVPKLRHVHAHYDSGTIWTYILTPAHNIAWQNRNEHKHWEQVLLGIVPWGDINSSTGEEPNCSWSSRCHIPHDQGWTTSPPFEIPPWNITFHFHFVIYYNTFTRSSPLLTFPLKYFILFPTTKDHQPTFALYNTDERNFYFENRISPYFRSKIL